MGCVRREQVCRHGYYNSVQVAVQLNLSVDLSTGLVHFATICMAQNWLCMLMNPLNEL